MAKAETSQSMHPGIYLVKTFFLMMLANAVVFYLANMFFPDNVVVGNMSLSHLWAIILSSGLLSLIVTFAYPFMMQMETQMKRSWSPPEMMGMYLVINVVSLWFITRASHIFGLGVTSWIVVLIMAFIANLLQGLVMVGVEKMQTKK